MTNDKKKVKDVDECLDELSEIEEKYMGNCGKKKFDTKNKPYTKIIGLIKDKAASWDEKTKKRVLYAIHEKINSQLKFDGISTLAIGTGMSAMSFLLDATDGILPFVVRGFLTIILMFSCVAFLFDILYEFPKRSRKLAFYQLVDEILTDSLRDENK